MCRMKTFGYSLHWHHNDHDSVSNHQPHGCLLNRLFRRRSKKTPKLCVTGLCAGNSPGPVNSPHKGPVTRKMFPFDDVIMLCSSLNVLKMIHHGGINLTGPNLLGIYNHFVNDESIFPKDPFKRLSGVKISRHAVQGRICHDILLSVNKWVVFSILMTEWSDVLKEDSFKCISLKKNNFIPISQNALMTSPRCFGQSSNRP